MHDLLACFEAYYTHKLQVKANLCGTTLNVSRRVVDLSSSTYTFRTILWSRLFLCRVEKETGMLFRFVMGHTESKAEEAAMNQEIEENGAFLRLPIQVLSATVD